MRNVMVFPASFGRVARPTADQGRTLASRTGDFLIRVFDVLGEWQDRTRSRRALASLDGRMLSDIGVGWGEAGEEAAKPFWRG